MKGDQDVTSIVHSSLLLAVRLKSNWIDRSLNDIEVAGCRERPSRLCGSRKILPNKCVIAVQIHGYQNGGHIRQLPVNW